MDKDLERIRSFVSQKRVKLHVFEPSQTKIWTVVGKSREHWIDPGARYCSCPGFYFGKLHGKTACYHLESAQLARSENKFETITFNDEEFHMFLSGLISDL